ncbi:MAG: YfiR family protein [Bdellovibrionales bacterium]|nr:YfiR family protein [Bdellovibrionales bacterium]
MVLFKACGRKQGFGCLSVFFYLLFAYFLLQAISVTAEEVRVTKIKAAHVFHLTKFTTWPEAAFSKDGSNFRVCVVGDENMLEFLSQITSGRDIQGKAYKIEGFKSTSTVSEVETCKILYLGSGAGSSGDSLAKKLVGKPVLSIGGAMKSIPAAIVNFYENDNKLGIQVDVSLAKKASLAISAELLSLAKVIGD